ncbi:MAG: hypothetical protein ACREEM_45350, partial [Blastocatellia bacterium]
DKRCHLSDNHLSVCRVWVAETTIKAEFRAARLAAYKLKKELRELSGRVTIGASIKRRLEHGNPQTT